MTNDTSNNTEDSERDKALKNIETIVEGVYSDSQFETRLDPHDLAELGDYPKGSQCRDGAYGQIILLDWDSREEWLLAHVWNGWSNLPEDRIKQIESLSDLTSDELQAVKKDFRDSADQTAFDWYILFKITDSKGRSVWYSLLLDGDIGFVDYRFDGVFYTSEEELLKPFKDMVDAGQEICEWET